MADAKSKFDDEAKDAVKTYIQAGRGCEATIELYNVHGAKYDQYLGALDFNGPAQAAKAAARLLGNRLDARILDVGAGTGLVSVELAKFGFKNIDAVDASEKFIEVAKSKGVYTNLFHQFVGLGQSLPTEKNTYDLAVMCGVIAENHLPPTAFDEIIRIVKPNGYIVNVFRHTALTAPWYGEGLEPYMQKLQKDGLWEEVSRTTFPNYVEGSDGLELMHRIL